VFLVGQNVPNKDHTALEEDFQDEPVRIVSDAAKVISDQ
jgi:hypothetical protein